MLGHVWPIAHRSHRVGETIELREPSHGYHDLIRAQNGDMAIEKPLL
jgi:hypothetical protein